MGNWTEITIKGENDFLVKNEGGRSAMFSTQDWESYTEGVAVANNYIGILNIHVSDDYTEEYDQIEFPKKGAQLFTTSENFKFKCEYLNDKFLAGYFSQVDHNNPLVINANTIISNEYGDEIPISCGEISEFKDSEMRGIVVRITKLHIYTTDGVYVIESPLKTNIEVGNTFILENGKVSIISPKEARRKKLNSELKRSKSLIAQELKNKERIETLLKEL